MTRTSEISSEADALNDILLWSQDRSVWQRDALRQLITTDRALSEQEILELSQLCKNPQLPHSFLTSEHINTQQNGAPTVTLKKVGNVQNVNALAEKESLKFIPKGMTIVYGDNGAGKSGYVRILKNACRARKVRGKDDAILRNIYGGQNGSQSVELEFLADTQTQETKWEIGTAPNSLLSQISVFDSRTANVHVEEANDLAYTPYPMRILERLVLACKGVKALIEKEISVIKSQTPKAIAEPMCSAQTKVGKIIHGLDFQTKPETIEVLATLSEGKKKRLAELNFDFAQDPEIAAGKLRAHKSKLEKIQQQINELSAAVSMQSKSELAKHTKNLETKREAAQLASQNFAREDELDGFGSESWRSLWEAARKYSQEQAYLTAEFPNVGEGARCVLCQQTLNEDAQLRLSKFEKFVQDRTQREAKEALTTLETKRKEISASKLPFSKLDKMRSMRSFISDELGNNDLYVSIRTEVIKLLWTMRSILKNPTTQLSSQSSFNSTPIRNCIDDLEDRANSLVKADENEDRIRLRNEREELKDRQWLAGIKSDVIAEIDRKKLMSKLENCVKDTRHNSITQKNTAFSAALVTDRLRGKFVREINSLKLAGLEIELSQAKSQSGVSRFRVNLIGSKTDNAGDILSEGEFRCVALASFMAELATNDSGSAIIFDDPVSSLDHLHREAIANRLAEEGRTRQLIVFTHDLPFLFTLRNACKNVDESSMKTEVALRHIQKRQKIPGYCRDQAPDKAQNVSEKIKKMRTHLKNCQQQYKNDPDSTDWLNNARELINSVRQAWEAAVEDTISPVMRTFSTKVNTKGFGKLSAITEENAQQMRQHYGTCSGLLHKASDSVNPVAPSPDTIYDEITAIENWLTAVTDRQKKIQTL